METGHKVVDSNSKAPEIDQRRFLAIVSPQARNYHPDTIKDIADFFDKAGLMVDFYPLDKSPRVAEEISQAVNKGYFSYLAVGGDGSVSLLASQLYRKPHRLGIIPIGTTNTIARILGIPLTVKKAIEMAASSRNIRPVDGLEVNGRIFILNVSVGLSSISLDSIDTKEKSKLGILAYALGIFRSRNKIKALNYDLQIDGNPCSTRAIELHVTNTGILGTPRYRIYQGSRIDDGRAEVLILRHWTVKEAINAFLDIVTRRKRQAIRLIGQGEDILIQSKTPIAVQADGDVLQQTPVRIRVLRQAINFIVP